MSEYPTMLRRPRRRRPRPGVRLIVAVLAALVTFGIGVALGMALHDNPKPGGSVTYIRTFVPTP